MAQLFHGLEQRVGCQIPGGTLQVDGLQRRRRVQGHQFAAIHERDPVAMLGFIHVMGGDENGRAFGALMISVKDQADHLLFAEITVQYYVNRSQPNVKAYYIETYSKDLAFGSENAALSELSPGSYRITFTMNGQLYERWVEVESGKLTEVVFVIK